LYVNNEPFLIIGAELLNSSSSSIDHMKDIWAHIKSLNVLNSIMYCFRQSRT
jgi:hypothetical protein